MPGQIILPNIHSNSSNIYITERSVPIGIYKDIAYGNGIYVAVGNGYVINSKDTYLWSPCAVTTRDWNTITFGNGYFIAIALDGYVIRSADGINWTSILDLYNKLNTDDSSSSIKDGIYELTYGNGISSVLVGGWRSRYVYSTNNGTTWTVTQTTDYYCNIAFGNNMWQMVAGGDDSSYHNKLSYSTNGINYTSIDTTGSWYHGLDFLEENNKFYSIMNIMNDGNKYSLVMKDSSPASAGGFNRIAGGVWIPHGAAGGIKNVAVKNSTNIIVLSEEWPNVLSFTKDEGKTWSQLSMRINTENVRCVNNTLFILGGTPTEGFMATLV